MASLENAELYRQTPGKSPQIIFLDLNKVLNKEASEANLLLKEEDHLFIKPNREWTEKKEITISGEVKFPGTYIAVKGERLSSLLKRAGGFTEHAFLKGAVFTRESVKKIQSRQIEEFIKSQRQALLREETSIAGVSKEEKEQRVEMLQRREELISLISQMEVPGRIVIQLLPLKDLASSRNDLLLEDGDKLYVPQIPESVTVVGSVRNPSSILYKGGKDTEYYVKKAGGLTKHADTKAIYIIESDGQAIGELAKMKGREITRGATIVVPEEFKYETPFGLLVRDASQVFYQIALGVAAVTVLR